MLLTALPVISPILILPVKMANNDHSPIICQKETCGKLKMAGIKLFHKSMAI